MGGGGHFVTTTELQASGLILEKQDETSLGTSAPIGFLGALRGTIYQCEIPLYLDKRSEASGDYEFIGPMGPQGPAGATGPQGPAASSSNHNHDILQRSSRRFYLYDSGTMIVKPGGKNYAKMMNINGPGCFVAIVTNGDQNACNAHITSTEIWRTGSSTELYAYFNQAVNVDIRINYAIFDVS